MTFYVSYCMLVLHSHLFSQEYWYLKIQQITHDCRGNCIGYIKSSFSCVKCVCLFCQFSSIMFRKKLAHVAMPQCLKSELHLNDLGLILFEIGLYYC